MSARYIDRHTGRPMSSCCAAHVSALVPGYRTRVPLISGDRRYRAPRCGRCCTRLTERPK